ncbi:MAG: substrate-binding domain-containing protein, partial [Cytophagales bacterium]|nr:substrate-binding domain-containing protein [Armatimonadota bacterium]
ERRPQSGTFLLALPAAPVRGDDCGIALIAPFQATSEPGSGEDAEWLYRVVSAFERVAVPAGARLLLKDQSPFLHDPCSIKDLAREAAAQGARAAILLHPAGPWEKITCALALLHDAGVHPVIVSGRDYPGLASRVYFDSGWGAYLATRHLLQQGHQRIAFLGVWGEQEWVTERLRGYRDALEAAEIEPDDAWVPHSETTRDPEVRAHAALERLLELPKARRPTAIVASNDALALALLRSAALLGVAVPAALSLVGFDNSPAALLAGLTTIERPTEALGEAIAHTTLARIAAGMEAGTVTQRLRPVLIERTTVACGSTIAHGANRELVCLSPNAKEQ